MKARPVLRSLRLFGKVEVSRINGTLTYAERVGSERTRYRLKGRWRRLVYYRCAAKKAAASMGFLTNDAPEELVGLRISAGLLAGVGCVFAIYPIGFAGLLVVLAFQLITGRASIFRPQSWLLMLAGLCVSTAVTYLIFRAASALRERQRWAAYLAMLFGFLFLVMSGGFMYDLYHPGRASPDEGFGIFFIPFCFLIGLWWCVYLNADSARWQHNFGSSAHLVILPICRERR